jgi:hypothetical protein
VALCADHYYGRHPPEEEATVQWRCARPCAQCPHPPPLEAAATMSRALCLKRSAHSGRVPPAQRGEDPTCTCIQSANVHKHWHWHCVCSIVHIHQCPEARLIGLGVVALHKYTFRTSTERVGVKVPYAGERSTYTCAHYDTQSSMYIGCLHVEFYGTTCCELRSSCS